MPATRYKVILTAEERDELLKLIATGKAKAKKLSHARILLQTDEGNGQSKPADAAIGRALNVSVPTIERVRKSFVEEGLDCALNRRKSRRVYQRKLDGVQEAHLIALACSEAPAGRSHWTMQLLADKLVELKYVERISDETVRRTLKKMN